MAHMACAALRANAAAGHLHTNGDLHTNCRVLLLHGAGNLSSVCYCITRIVHLSFCYSFDFLNTDAYVYSEYISEISTKPEILGFPPSMVIS